MELLAIGLNYQSAPLALRERLVFNSEQIGDALRSLRQHGLLRSAEAAILSTCNRTEIYCAPALSSADTSSPHHLDQDYASQHHGGATSNKIVQPLLDWLTRERNLSMPELSPHLYQRPSLDAVRHAFRVACGLDSMVLGEPEILGQMKQAARQAQAAGTLGPVLGQLFQRSFAVAKAVRTSTRIGSDTVSMAAASVKLAQRIFGQLHDRKVLFIGAGEMIDRVAAHFIAQRPRHIAVANRSLTRAQQLAQRCQGEAMTLADLPKQLANFDIIVTCTASTLPLLGYGMVERASKSRRQEPMFIVDLAVPRDVEAEVARLDDVFLYTLDDLGDIVQTGRDSRAAAAAEAQAIIERGVLGFSSWWREREALPAFQHTLAFQQAVLEHEIQRTQQALDKALRLGQPTGPVLATMAHRLSQKHLHGLYHSLHHGSDLERQQLQALLPKLLPNDLRLGTSTSKFSTSPHTPPPSENEDS